MKLLHEIEIPKKLDTSIANELLEALEQFQKDLPRIKRRVNKEESTEDKTGEVLAEAFRKVKKADGHGQDKEIPFNERFRKLVKNDK